MRLGENLNKKLRYSRIENEFVLTLAAAPPSSDDGDDAVFRSDPLELPETAWS